jgi:ABC-type multidrug transport system ATPase subunit
MIKDVIRRLSSEGVTIFLATHSLHIAEELCERVGFISKGSIISIKDKKEIVSEGGLQELFLKTTS